MPLTAQDNSAMTTDEIKSVQLRLKLHGFDPGPVDGILGPRTSAAIIAFKRSVGLVARPWVGPITWSRLLQGADHVNRTGASLPPWVQEGLRIKGWHERDDNAELKKWLKSDGRALGDPAVFPWCGDFVETCIRLALPNEPFPGPLGVNPYWALNWRHLGEPCTPCLGAVISITRSGGGHVGFAVGCDDDRIFVLGGNQANAVSIAPIDKDRFEPESWRWPATYTGAQRVLPRMTSAEASEFNFA